MTIPFLPNRQLCFAISAFYLPETAQTQQATIQIRMIDKVFSHNKSISTALGTHDTCLVLLASYYQSFIQITQKEVERRTYTESQCYHVY